MGNYNIVELAITGLAFNATQIISAGANTQVNFYKRRIISLVSLQEGKCVITLSYKNFADPQQDETLDSPCSELTAFFSMG